MTYVPMQVQNKLNIPGKNILIVGNRSYKNMGDELILLWTVKLLLQEGKTITIAAYDPEWLKKFLSQFIESKHITFVTEIPKGIRSRINYIRQQKWKERKLYRKTDAVIIGWGEILTEENPNSYRYRLVSLLPCRSKPRYLMWWIQIAKNIINRLLFSIVLKKTKHIFARDKETVDELKTYGYHNVDFFMDTAYFAYDRESVTKSSSQKGTDNKYIVVNLNKNAEQFLPEIIQDIKKIYNQWYKVIYVPVAKWKNEYYNDIKYAEKIKKWAKIKDQDFKIEDRENDFMYFTKVISGADTIISSRLHLFLVASFLEIPTKVYPYQKKILKMQKIIDQLQKTKKIDK